MARQVTAVTKNNDVNQTANKSIQKAAGATDAI